MKSFWLIISLFLCIQSNGQLNLNNYSIKLKSFHSKDNYRATRNLNNYLNEQFQENYNIVYHSNITISSKAKLDNLRLIEGMDVKHVGKPKLEFRIQEKNTKKDTTLTYEYQIEGNNRSVVVEKLVESFIEDSDAIKEVIAISNAFITQCYIDHCSSIEAHIKSLLENNQSKQSLKQLVNFKASKCSPNSDKLYEEVLNKIAQKSCDQKLQEAKIMINSGVMFQMKRAIPILTSIPPNAPCANDAIELSKEIGKQLETTSKHYVELQNYQQNKLSKWEKNYLYKILSEN